MSRRNRNLSFLLFLLLVVSSAVVRGEDVVRVACVGNSITFGAGIRNRSENCYPAQLGKALGDRYQVRNFGVSGATLLKKGDKPYWKEQALKSACEFRPHVVVIKLGTNDTKPFNWKHKDDFEPDLTAMVDHFAALPEKPRVMLCKPVPVFRDRWGINDKTVREGVIPIISAVAKKKSLPVVDLYEALNGQSRLFPDGVHPDADGAKIIADTVRQAILDDR